MSVLLIAEHNNKEIRPFTLNAVTAFKVNDLSSLLLCSVINNTDIILLLPRFLVFEPIQQH